MTYCLGDNRDVSDHALIVTPGRGQHANRPYEEDTFSENESSSSYGGNRQKKRRGSPSPPAYEQDMDSVVPDADATASSSTAPDSSYVASVSQIDSPVIVSPLAPEPINSDPSGASASLASSHTPTATFTARAYAARFAYPSVCVCAESSVALDAVQRLIGAVRDAAAVFTNLHAEASAEHQCALLGRILELEGFLWWVIWTMKMRKTIWTLKLIDSSLTAMFTAVALPADVAAVPVGGRNDALLLSPVSMARADRPVGQMPYAPWNGALVGEMSFHRSFDAAAGALGEGIGGPDPSY